MRKNIAIDGPAGAGKSTIAKMLAMRLGSIYVDTGAMYRALGLYFIRNGIDAKEEQKILASLDLVEVTIEYRDGEQKILLNGEDVSVQIRREEVGNMASASSGYPAVREKMMVLQRKLAKEQDVVMDGRDIGTVVLPDAYLKIYLTASVATRAKRRYDQLVEKGETPDLAKIETEIEERDYRDMNRATAPLKQAEDAYLLDSSDLGIEEVVDAIMKLYEEKAM